MTTNRNQLLGRQGEDLAADFLRRRGMRIVDRRVRYRRGELDIVARDGAEWVFVEVKTRSSGRMGVAAEAFTGRKLGSLARAAREYIDIHDLHHEPIRCDLVAIDFDAAGLPEITHYPAAASLGR